MTYSDLAGTELSRAEVRQLIEGEGLRFSNFADEVGEASYYHAETVLTWLGM